MSDHCFKELPNKILPIKNLFKGCLEVHEGVMCVVYILHECTVGDDLTVRTCVDSQLTATFPAGEMR